MRRVMVALCLLAPVAAGAAPGLQVFKAVAMAPDGRHFAAVETSGDPEDASPAAAMTIRDLDGHVAVVQVPCAAAAACEISSPVWNDDSSVLAFLVARSADNTSTIQTVGQGGGRPAVVVSFPGPMGSLRYGPGHQLAVLATANARKKIGRAQAGAPIVGEIGALVDEQRIALVRGHGLAFVSPANLYVYEYDWRPDGGFVATAAAGDGDSQWWVARLYAFDASGAGRVLFTPGPREQLTAPVVSPDGRSAAFIGGWMSDFGSPGGDAFTLALDQKGAVPTNLTGGWTATVTGLNWHCGDGLTGVTLAADTVNLVRLDQAGAKPVWSGQSTLAAGADAPLSCSTKGAAAAVSSFTAAPEILAGPLGHWRQVTPDNAGMTAPLAARSVSWRNGQVGVQGWLLTAPGAAGPRPLIVLVHGGPEAAVTSHFLAPTSQTRALLAEGWDVFMPNYRGSYGQGEAFAAGSIQDLGGGDWSDVLTGLDAAERAVPIDDSRLGIMGGSYGGYMAMWAVTATHRFRAAFSHAGVSDWFSLEGEAPQAGSDQVNFGGSVYDNAAPYLRASPVMHMRGVTTPVLITVGERDLECPMPQSQEFDTALKAVGVASAFVVYAGEGHHFARRADRDDERRRMLGWFHRWFGK